MATKKGGLGKGLDAIFMENATENSNSTVTLKISELEPNQDQPRREFDDEAPGGAGGFYRPARSAPAPVGKAYRRRRLPDRGR